MAGPRFSPTCFIALESPAVWNLPRQSLHRSERKRLPLSPAPEISPPLSFESLLQLSEEAPVRTLLDNLLRGGLDHADLMEAEGVEAQRILRVVPPPLAVGDILHDLEGVVIALRHASIQQGPT